MAGPYRSPRCPAQPIMGLDILHPLESGGFQPRLAPCCRFAVHRPGSPVASPRSHGMPCRGFVPGSSCACLAIADIFDYTTMRSVGAAFFPRPEGRALHAAILVPDPSQVGLVHLLLSTTQEGFTAAAGRLAAEQH